MAVIVDESGDIVCLQAKEMAQAVGEKHTAQAGLDRVLRSHADDTGVDGGDGATGVGSVRFSPNPFTDSSRLSFDVPDHMGPVRLVVYNAAGRIVRTLVDGPMERGRHELAWDGIDDAGRRASSGVYFVRLEVDGQSLARKLIMLR